MDAKPKQARTRCGPIEGILRREPLRLAMSQAPQIGRLYVCRNTAPPGWAGDTVRVLGVCVEKKTARVEEMDGRYKTEGEPLYTTVVHWDDLILDPRAS